MEKVHFVETGSESFFGNYLYYQVVPAQHFLRKLNQTDPPPSTSQPAQPAETSQPALDTAEPVFQIDHSDLHSVAQGFLWMLEHRVATVLGDIIDEEYFHLTNNPIEGGKPYQKDELIRELQNRLDNSSRISCLSFHQDADGIKIWTAGWSPEWVMTDSVTTDAQRWTPACSAIRLPLFLSHFRKNIPCARFLSANMIKTIGTHLAKRPFCPATQDPASFSMQAPACRGLLPTRLKVNGFAYVSTDPPVPNRVRSGPGKNYQVIGQIQPGKGMEIIDGPHCADGMV